MRKYDEIEGDLITYAREGKFDVIVHGCNCFCQMGAGLAPQMAKAFGCDQYKLEQNNYKGDINKLGQIDYETFVLSPDGKRSTSWVSDTLPQNSFVITVINAYTQYKYGINHSDGNNKPIDYEALTLCMRKINKKFNNQRIGLPQIGAGLAQGNWNRIKNIIQSELLDCDVTVVIFKKS